MRNTLYITSIILLIFTGCSSKQYFEPEDTYRYNENTKELDNSIIDLNSDGATLENNTFVSESGIFKNNKEGFEFVNMNENTIISTDNNANINLKDDLLDITLKFEKNIISASKHDNLLAFGSIDNSITLYNIDTKQVLFKEYLKTSPINNIKIANPIFLKTVILYPTLDGKVVIVDLKKNTIVKTINIDPKSDINNVMFLKEVNNTLIAATSNKLFTFVNGKVKLQDLDVQSIIVKKNNIYVATLDGQIIKYNFFLQKIASKKFKFAKINALAFGTSLYALESQGFLIRIDEDFKDFKIFDFSFDNEEKVIGIDNKIYFNDEYTILK